MEVHVRGQPHRHPHADAAVLLGRRAVLAVACSPAATASASRRWRWPATSRRRLPRLGERRRGYGNVASLQPRPARTHRWSVDLYDMDRDGAVSTAPDRQPVAAPKRPTGTSTPTAGSPTTSATRTPTASTTTTRSIGPMTAGWWKACYSDERPYPIQYAGHRAVRRRQRRRRRARRRRRPGLRRRAEHHGAQPQHGRRPRRSRTTAATTARRLQRAIGAPRRRW